jgi:hypothetical protein
MSTLLQWQNHPHASGDATAQLMMPERVLATLTEAS